MRIPSSILLLLALAAPATVGAQRFEAAERVQEVPGLDRVGVDEHLDEELGHVFQRRSR